MPTLSVEEIMRTVRAVIRDIPEATDFEPIFDLAYNLHDRHEISFVQRGTGRKSPVRIHMGNDRSVSVDVLIYQTRPIAEDVSALTLFGMKEGAVVAPLSNEFTAALAEAFREHPGVEPVREPGMAVHPCTRLTYSTILEAARRVDPEVAVRVNEDSTVQGNDEITVLNSAGDRLATIWTLSSGLEVYAGMASDGRKVGSTFRQFHFDGLAQMVETAVAERSPTFAL